MVLRAGHRLHVHLAGHSPIGAWGEPDCCWRLHRGGVPVPADGSFLPAVSLRALARPLRAADQFFTRPYRAGAQARIAGGGRGSGLSRL